MPPRGKQASGLLTQQKMLRAAVKLFLEKGYEGTTTAEIARAAGMTPSSFFRAFPSKEALLLELVQRMFSGQFALAGQHSGEQDPVLLYAVETALQLHIAELTEPLRRMPWIEAMEKYGSDKPDLRFGMEFADLTDLAQGHGFTVFDDAEYVTGFAATGCAGYTRKQIDALTEFVKRQQIGAKGLVWIRVEADGNVKSSVDKFYSPEQVRAMAERAGAKAGDLVLILCGKKFKTLTQLCALRLEVAQQLGLRDPKKFAPLWVIDFPLFEWDDETQRYYAVHHPFTSPKLEDVQYLDNDPGRVRANAYDFVCNGTEIGGGSIRIHDSKLQAKMFELLGFTAEQAQERFGFLMNAFKYGAPPHGGLAFGFDRLCSLFGGSESIRDYIAFPKNNNGRDMMLDAPGYIDQAQLDELHIQLVKPEE